MHLVCPGKIWTHTPSHQQPSCSKWWRSYRTTLQQTCTDCTRLAQHALHLEPDGYVQSDLTVSAQSAQSSDSTIQPDPAQEPIKPEPTCLAPRVTAIKEQGFSEAVAALIEAPQRGSTWSVYESKWTIFTKWCLSNQVDYRALPLKAISDLFLYLFQDSKLQLGTIDGSIDVSKDENLTRPHRQTQK